MARYAQPPSPQYSPTGFVPISPWSAAQSPQSMYPAHMYPPPPQAGPPQHYNTPQHYSTPGAAPGGYFGYPSPPTSNSSTNSPSSQRPGFTLHYGPPARPEQPLRPTTPTDRREQSAPPEDVSYRPVSRNSNRPSDRRARSRDRASHDYDGRRRRPGSPDEMYAAAHIPVYLCLGVDELLGQDENNRGHNALGGKLMQATCLSLLMNRK